MAGVQTIQHTPILSELMYYVHHKTPIEHNPAMAETYINNALPLALPYTNCQCGWCATRKSLCYIDFTHQTQGDIPPRHSSLKVNVTARCCWAPTGICLKRGRDQWFNMP